MNLGNTITDIRKAKGLKQYELASACDITQTYLSQIEANKKEPNLSTLKSISLALEIPLPILFFMSIDEEDVPSNRKGAFEILQPTLKSLINDLFIAPKG